MLQKAFERNERNRKTREEAAVKAAEKLAAKLEEEAKQLDYAMTIGVAAHNSSRLLAESFLKNPNACKTTRSTTVSRYHSNYCRYLIGKKAFVEKLSADQLYENFYPSKKLPAPPEAPLERAMKWILASNCNKIYPKDDAILVIDFCIMKYDRGRESMVRDLNVGGPRTVDIQKQIKQNHVDLTNPGEKDLNLDKVKVNPWGGRVSTRDQSQDDFLRRVVQKNMDTPSEEFIKSGYVSAYWFNRWVVEAKALEGVVEEVSVVYTPDDVKKFFQKYAKFLHRQLGVYQNNMCKNDGVYTLIKEEPKESLTMASHWDEDAKIANMFIKVEDLTELPLFDFQQGYVVKTEHTASMDSETGGVRKKQRKYNTHTPHLAGDVIPSEPTDETIETLDDDFNRPYEGEIRFGFDEMFLDFPAESTTTGHFASNPDDGAETIISSAGVDNRAEIVSDSEPTTTGRVAPNSDDGAETIISSAGVANSAEIVPDSEPTTTGLVAPKSDVVDCADPAAQSANCAANDTNELEDGELVELEDTEVVKTVGDVQSNGTSPLTVVKTVLEVESAEGATPLTVIQTVFEVESEAASLQLKEIFQRKMNELIKNKMIPILIAKEKKKIEEKKVFLSDAEAQAARDLLQQRLYHNLGVRPLAMDSENGGPELRTVPFSAIYKVYYVTYRNPGEMEERTERLAFHSEGDEYHCNALCEFGNITFGFEYVPDGAQAQRFYLNTQRKHSILFLRKLGEGDFTLLLRDASVSNVKAAVLYDDGSSVDLPVLPFIRRHHKMSKAVFERQLQHVIRTYWKPPLILESKCTVLYIHTPMYDQMGREDSEPFEFKVFSSEDKPVVPSVRRKKHDDVDDGRPELWEKCKVSDYLFALYRKCISVTAAVAQVKHLDKLLSQRDSDYGTIIHAHMYSGMMSKVEFTESEYKLAEKLHPTFAWLQSYHLRDFFMLVRFKPRVEGSLFLALAASLKFKYQGDYHPSGMWSSTLEWLYTEKAFNTLVVFSHEQDGGQGEEKRTHAIGRLFYDLILKKQAGAVWKDLEFGKGKLGYDVALSAWQAMISEMRLTGRFSFYNAYSMNEDAAYDCSDDLLPELRSHFEALLIAGYVTEPNRYEYTYTQVTVFDSRGHRLEYVGRTNDFHDVTEDAKIVRVQKGAYLSIVELEKW